MNHDLAAAPKVSASSTTAMSVVAAWTLGAQAGLSVFAGANALAATGYEAEADAALRVAGAGDMVVSTAVSLGGNPSFEARGAAEMGFIEAWEVTGGTGLVVEGNAEAMLSTAFSLSAMPSFRVKGSGFFVGATDTDGMTVCDVAESILEMWGILCMGSAPRFATEAAVDITNKALQLVWNNAEGRDFWTKETMSLTVLGGTSSLPLPDEIQSIPGPCRRADNRQPLIALGTMGELETFSDLYLDGSVAERPVAYHVERSGQSEADPAKCVFHVNQETDEDTTFLLDVVKEAPRFSGADLLSCPLIPIPHQYVESLLLPVARYHATSYYLFRQEEKKEGIARDYAEALGRLGLADPLPGKAGDNRNKEGLK